MAYELKNIHATKITSELYLNDEFADFNFTFEGKKVPVHKNILAAGSKVFRAQFFGEIKDKDSVEIIHSNIHAFKVFLQFFYLDKVTLRMEHIEEVVKLADYYDMLDCVYDCVEFLMGQLTDQNVIWCYQLAILLDNHTLIQSCEYIVAHLTKNVIKSDAFNRCDQKTLENILKMNELACDESEVFEACISWAKHAAQQNGMDENNAENLRKQLGDCFYFIRFAAMKIDEFATSTKDYKDLFTRDEMADIMYATTKACVKPTIFCQVPRISLDLSKWNDGQKFICQRSSGYDADWSKGVSMKLQFSVNIRALLGEVCCIPIYDSVSWIPIVQCFSIEILEIGNQSQNASPDEKVIFAGSFQTVKEKLAKIPLFSALIINPKKTYEIRVENEEGGNIVSSYYCEWKPQYKYDKKHIVKILSGRDSLIGFLSFKRL